MKKLAVIGVLIALPLLGSNDLKRIGDRFCNEIIDGFSPGTSHVIDCLASVKELVAWRVPNQQSLIKGICQDAPNFSYSMGECSEQDCIDAAKSEGFLE